MTIKVNEYGAYVISDIICGQLYRCQYYGYTKKESVKMFKAFIKGIKQ